MTPHDAMELGRRAGAAMVDLKFVDLPGKWHHVSLPFDLLEESSFEDGFGFDGSGVRGYQPINQADMLLVPDPATARLDPFFARATLSMECVVVDPLTRQNYSRDPRHVARKAEAYLRASGIADTCRVGPGAEFFVFDDVRSACTPQGASFTVDVAEAPWNGGRDERPNLAHKLRPREGYSPTAPEDTLADLRADVVAALARLGVAVELSHHGSAPGQCGIDLRHDELARMADQLLWLKYVVKNTARAAGRTATFMPKPLPGEGGGNALHVNLSLFRGDEPLFAGDAYAGLSDTALWFLGGVLTHAPSLAAFTNPTTNSYRRLGPEAPVNLAYSSRNRSASVRIATYSSSPRARRLEVRFPDPAASPHLALAALLMAGLDGIERQLDPGDPLDKDIYSLAPEELEGVPRLPTSLEDALRALRGDHAYLLRGDVFTSDLIEKWLELKEERELQPTRAQPTPLEFALYYDA